MVVQAKGLTGAVGFVAAGGRSLRMGRDKALLPWRGSTLLDHAIARLRAVTGEVAILCGASLRYEDRGVPLLLDVVPDAGPLAGLDAALAAAPGQTVLLLGVDLPFVTTAILESLLGQRQGCDAVIPVVAGRHEPLCAVYGPGCAPAVRARLEAGERKMTSFLADVRVREPGETDLAGLGDIVSLFRNLNTPRDFEDAQG